jgi:hypothetical protein
MHEYVDYYLVSLSRCTGSTYHAVATEFINFLIWSEERMNAHLSRVCCRDQVDGPEIEITKSLTPDF